MVRSLSAPLLPSCEDALLPPAAAVAALSFSARRAPRPGQRPPRHSCGAESFPPHACSVSAHSRPCPSPSFSSLVNASSRGKGRLSVANSVSLSSVLSAGVNGQEWVVNRRACRSLAEPVPRGGGGALKPAFLWAAGHPHPAGGSRRCRILPGRELGEPCKQSPARVPSDPAVPLGLDPAVVCVRVEANAGTVSLCHVSVRQRGLFSSSSAHPCRESSAL